MLDMKKAWFPITVLLIGFILTQVYYLATIAFSGYDQLQADTITQQKYIAQQNLILELKNYQFQQYKIEVAKLIPHKIKKNEFSYPQRKLASIVRGSDSLLGLDAEELMEKANKHFKAGECRSANSIYKKIKNEYSYSSRIVEAYFLSSECYYNMGLSSLAVESITAMTKLFPTSELTGYALIRFAEIQKQESRIESAKETYLKVINNFPYPELASQAREGLRSVLL